MILYGFYYCPCIYESAPGLQSLHKTKEGAEAAMENFLKEYLEGIEALNKDCIELGLPECVKEVKFSDYRSVFVDQIEVQQ